MFQKGDIVRLKNGRAPMVVKKVRFPGNSSEAALCCVYYRTQEALENYGDAVVSTYTGTAYDQTNRAACDFTYYEGDPEKYYSGKTLDEIQAEGKALETQKETDMTKLYQTKDENHPRFGTFLTKNSAGHLVLEMKGENGKVEAFPADALTEVVPYTVRVEGAATGTTDYEAPEGLLEKNDVLLSPGGCMYVVTAIDTRARGARPLPKGLRRVMTEALDAAVVDNS